MEILAMDLMGAGMLVGAVVIAAICALILIR